MIGQRIETSSLAGSYQQRAVYCECAVLDRGHKGKLNRCNGREPQGVSAMAAAISAMTAFFVFHRHSR